MIGDASVHRLPLASDASWKRSADLTTKIQCGLVADFLLRKEVFPERDFDGELGSVSAEIEEETVLMLKINCHHHSEPGCSVKLGAAG